MKREKTKRQDKKHRKQFYSVHIFSWLLDTQRSQVKKVPRFQAAEPFSGFQSAEKYRRSFALLDKPSNPSDLRAQAALGSNDNQAALQTDLHGDLATAQATHDRFGHARAEGLFPLADKLAPFLAAPKPDPERCTSKVRKQPCQRSHREKAKLLH
jgi:hypothetical protein